jgi:hypothetical protein
MTNAREESAPLRLEVVLPGARPLQRERARSISNLQFPISNMKLFLGIGNWGLEIGDFRPAFLTGLPSRLLKK